MAFGVVVITGAAGALGSATAAYLSRKDIQVVGIDIADTAPPEAELEHYLGGIDLTDAMSANTALAEIAAKHGPISGLVNIAGGFAWETVEDGSVDTWEKLWSLNVKTCLNTTRAALTHFAETGGAIVNVSAAATHKADTGMAAYTATKSAVSRLTESLASELKDRDIRVNAVMPTIIDTPANRADMPDDDFEKWVKPKELAQVFEFLLSPLSSAVTGALLPVAGRV
ncbi:SDR family NAD(P)-dependent oxidoreductase [Ponticaulis profundi]|uniref:SDR family NAD(P)-dependent oxidoreductase n=1 Tax=Ponticaulis profundi TaxID=2665222 RepID=A0ABW1S9Z6_9PROT